MTLFETEMYIILARSVNQKEIVSQVKIKNILLES